MHRFIEQIYRNTKNYKGVIFLDRDGTINEEVNYLSNVTDLTLLPQVIDGIRLLNRQHIAVIVITNQPVIARGLISVETLKKINNTLVAKLNKQNVFIEAIYSCPHHPESDHTDIPPYAMKYRIVCDCRKPSIAMPQQASKKYGISQILGFIGDQPRDILTAKALNIPSVLVKTGKKNLLDAVKVLLT